MYQNESFEFAAKLLVGLSPQFLCPPEHDALF